MKENEDPCKASFLDLLTGVHDKKKKIKLNYLIKWMPFPFILIACPIWIAIYRLRYFMLQPFGNFKYCRDNN